MGISRTVEKLVTKSGKTGWVFGLLISDLEMTFFVLILANLNNCFPMILGNDVFVLISLRNKVFILTLANLHNSLICIITFHPDYGKQVLMLTLKPTDV